MTGTASGRSNTGFYPRNRDVPVGAPVKQKNFVLEVIFGMAVYSNNQNPGVFQYLRIST